MNGVAREFWREVYDIRAAAEEPRAGRASRARKKAVRRIQARRKAGRFGTT